MHIEDIIELLCPEDSETLSEAILFRIHNLLPGDISSENMQMYLEESNLIGDYGSLIRVLGTRIPQTVYHGPQRSYWYRYDIELNIYVMTVEGDWDFGEYSEYDLTDDYPSNYWESCD